MFCSNCGTNNPDGTGFCSNCGSALGAAAQPVQQQYAQPAYTQPVQPAYTQPMNYGGSDYRDNDEIRRASSCARKALTLGIFSILLSWTVLFGILFGAIGIKKASSAKKLGSGGGKAAVGKVFSIIGLIFSILIIVYYIVAILGIIASGTAQYTREAKRAMKEQKNAIVRVVDLSDF